MANVLKISAHHSPVIENLLSSIKNLCLEHPENDLAVWIKNLIDQNSIPAQMDRDLIRRLTDPACNPLDFRFDLPIDFMKTDYEKLKLNNQILIEQ